MGKLRYNISGLEEFVITFEDYCVPCPIQKHCRYGKTTPFQISLECKDLLTAFEKKKNEEMDKLGRKNPDWDWDMREKKAKVTKAQVYSLIWNDKVKNHKEELLCIDSRRTDSMLTAQRGEEWWTDFRDLITKIDTECSKIS